MQIQTRLMKLVLSILLSAILVAVFGIYYVYVEGEQSVERSMRETTKALALILDEELESREAVLKTLSLSDALRRDDIAGFEQEARRHAQARNATIVLLKPGTGHLIDTSAPPGEAEKYKTTVFPALRARYSTDATLVSDLFKRNTTGHQEFSVQIPVKLNGQVRYFLSLGEPSHRIQSLFSEQHLPVEWIASIVDRNGIVVARSVDADKFVGNYIGDVRQNYIKGNDQGFIRNTLSISNEKVVTYFHRAPKSGWTFIVSVPHAVAYRGATRAAVGLGAVFLLLIGVAVSSAMWMARRTVAPLEALRKKAERLAEGEQFEAEVSGLLEVDAVGAALARASKDLRQTRLELEQRMRESMVAADRSRRALLQAQRQDAVGRMAGSIAHEFNNVLQTLTTGLQLVHAANRDSRIQSSLEVCRLAVQKAGNLASQLMAAAHDEEPQCQVTDLAGRLPATLPMLQGCLGPAVMFRFEAKPNLWPVSVDPLQLELTLLNLTMNARDAMPSGGMLRLHVFNVSLAAPYRGMAPGDYVCLSVDDNGFGMDDDELTQARGWASGAPAKSGVGLFQAGEFARASQGGLLINSREGGGTEVLLLLPKAVIEAPAQESLPPEVRRVQPRRGGRVLFVEDEPMVRTVVAQALEEHGLRVVVAINGDEALGLLEVDKEFDVVFSDIVMPGRLSGLDLAKTVRRRFPDIDVILATGYKERWAVLPGIRTLAKPYDVTDVVNAVWAALTDAPATVQAADTPA